MRPGSAWARLRVGCERRENILFGVVHVHIIRSDHESPRSRFSLPRDPLVSVSPIAPVKRLRTDRSRRLRERQSDPISVLMCCEAGSIISVIRTDLCLIATTARLQDRKQGHLHFQSKRETSRQALSSVQYRISIHAGYRSLPNSRHASSRHQTPDQTTNVQPRQSTPPPYSSSSSPESNPPSSQWCSSSPRRARSSPPTNPPSSPGTPSSPSAPASARPPRPRRARAG